MHALQSLDGLELHNHEPIHNQVEPLRAKLPAAIIDCDLELTLKGQAR